MSKAVEGKLPDARARDAIAGDLDSNYIVEAGAGTGKTYSLVSRIIALIASGKCRVDSLVAVTFTRKAAAEMRERFQIGLEEAVAEQGLGEEERENLARALSGIERTFIGTIHSFCGRLLRERPIEAGIDPSFEEVDETGRNALLNEAWYEFLTTGANPERIRRLHALGFRQEEIREAFISMSDYPDVEIVHSVGKEPDVYEALDAVFAFLDQARAMLHGKVPAKSKDKLQPKIRKAQGMKKFLDMKEVRNAVALLKLFSSRDSGVVLKGWPEKDDAKKIRDSLYPALVENYVAPALARWREYCHGLLIEFVRPAVDFARKYRFATGRLTYQDLLMETARVLRERPDIRRYFSEKFTHILVDEFQDTDPVQSEILFYLCCPRGDMNKKDWRSLGLVPGKLFVVGDPKQSIYRFRRADIRSYMDVRERVMQTGGSALNLTTNFRSNPAICDWVSSVFENVFPKIATGRQAAFTEQSAHHIGVPEGALSGVYRLIVPPAGKGRDSKEKSNMRTAPLVARVIAHAVNGGWLLADEKDRGKTRTAVPGDFLVLTRTKAPLAVYAQALEEYGIPCEVTGSDTEETLDAIRELILLASSIGDPADPIRLTAVLRGPFFGVSDDALYRFKGCGGDFDFLSRPPANTPLEIVNAFAQLKKYWQWTDELPAVTALEKIIGDIGIIPLEASRPLGTGRAGLLMQFLELARNTGPENAPSFHALVSHLDELADAGALGDANLFPGGTGAVRIMNLHKAKGLEARIVILAEPQKGREHAPLFHVDRSSYASKGYFTISRKLNQHREIIAQPREWDAISTTESEFLNAEKKRLLYVAATRAADALVVCGAADKPEKNGWQIIFDAIPQENCLEIPEVRVAPLPKVEFTQEELETATSLAEKSFAALGQETYSVSTVTAEAKKEAAPPTSHVRGRGMKWGSVIHGALEEMGRGMEGAQLERFIRNRLVDEDMPPAELGEILDYLEKVRSNELWERMLNSDKKLYEVPFSIKTTAGRLNNKDKPSDYPVILSGRIDLVFREKAGWVIADYKSDKVSGNIEALREYYSPQLLLYAEYWKEITGDPISEILLHFLITGELVTVEHNL